MSLLISNPLPPTHKQIWLFFNTAVGFKGVVTALNSALALNPAQRRTKNRSNVQELMATMRRRQASMAGMDVAPLAAAEDETFASASSSSTSS